MNTNGLSQNQINCLIHIFTKEESGTIIFIEGTSNTSLKIEKFTSNHNLMSEGAASIERDILITWVKDLNSPLTIIDINARRIISNSELARFMDFHSNFSTVMVSLETEWKTYVNEITSEACINQEAQLQHTKKCILF